MKHCCGAKKDGEAPLQTDSEPLLWAPGTAPEGASFCLWAAEEADEV